ncbi:hypothetical protein PRIPAC_83126 [Pristionchus pacificus]|uniref:Uncharacterized protein n=1 Tax=Pristionchus pacificus TaxID=54126 RepID=A0A2A6BLP8_PRIPA|nr:hypothetical protein PRIPAC_83126 [Pristionchus pacificus]|eukprot:PDM66736.1 hypothetical protein PRIPAC_48153 [Pristionchus pacificus]
MADHSTLSSDPNSSARRPIDPNQDMNAKLARVLSPPQVSSTPPSKSNSLQKSLIVDKTQVIQEERRNRMRSMGIHVAADNDDRTVYELPVVIKRTKSRRRVHKLKWKNGIVDPDAQSDTDRENRIQTRNSDWERLLKEIRKKRRKRHRQMKRRR